MLSPLSPTNDRWWEYLESSWLLPFMRVFSLLLSRWFSMMLLMSALMSKMLFILMVSSLFPVDRKRMLVKRILPVDFVLQCEKGFIFLVCQQGSRCVSEGVLIELWCEVVNLWRVFHPLVARAQALSRVAW